jgi:hypothetical protein
MQTLQLIMLVFGGAVLLVVLVLMSQNLLARNSRWFALAKTYRVDAPFAGRLLRFGAQFPGAWYEWVKVGVNESGLYVAPPWLLGLTLQPMLIPWKDIEIRERRWTALNVATIYIGSDQVAFTGWMGPEFTNKFLGCYDAVPRPGA